MKAKVEAMIRDTGTLKRRCLERLLMHVYMTKPNYASTVIMGMGSLTKKSVRVYICLSPPKSRARAATTHRIFRSLLCAFKLAGIDNVTVRESTTEKWEPARPRLGPNIQIMYESARGRLEIVWSPL